MIWQKNKCHSNQPDLNGIEYQKCLSLSFCQTIFLSKIPDRKLVRSSGSGFFFGAEELLVAANHSWCDDEFLAAFLVG